MLEPICLGRRASHELAPEFAGEIARVLARYVEEVVMRYALCPFLKSLELGLGTLCVVLDDEPDVELGVKAVREAPTPVVHVVFPLLTLRPEKFERFGSSLQVALKKQMNKAPLHASFHPELAGDVDDPHRLVGLLRRAPDPFVQFIPANIQEAGFKVTGGPPAIANTENIFETLKGDVLDEVFATMANIRADRERSYDRFRRAFGLPILPEHNLDG